MTSHTITGTWPAGYNVTAATLFNQGTISGPLPGNGVGLYSKNSADIINRGVITPGILHPAVGLHAGGTLTNQSGGTIGGAFGVSISGGAGTVVNAGSIRAAPTSGVGINLAATSVGTITNAASGSITGAVGIELLAGGMLTNAGTISGSGGTAVAFGGTGSNLLALDPGARFMGVVTGSASAKNELELASASGVGTVNGFGVSFSNFATISVDAGASWDLGAANTIGAGKTLLVAGTLANDGSILSTVTLNDGSLLSNASSGTIGGGGVYMMGYNGAHLVNAGTIAGVSGKTNATVTNAGSIAGVEVNDSLYLTNSSSGLITGDSYGTALGTGGGDVVNYGSITGRFGLLADLGITIVNEASASIYGSVQAINSNEGTGITNGVSASITSPFFAVYGYRGLNLYNQGTIVATGPDSTGVRVSYDLYATSITNSVSASIAGGDGVYVLGSWTVGDVATVVNDGSIDGRGSGLIRNGATVAEGAIGFGPSALGFVSNGSAGSITGNQYGIFGAATVVNDGAIAGTHGDGVSLTAGSAITNAASASIAGGRDGVDLSAGGPVENAGTIHGGRFGVDLPAGGTLTNAGTIIGHGGTAVSFGDTGPGLLVLKPGFAFTGAVTGSASASDTVELASAASAGVLTGLGTEFVNFDKIVLDAGGTWAVGGTMTARQTLLAAEGSTLMFQFDAGNTNNAGGVLTGGTWEADGSGSTLSVTGGSVAKDKATIILSGAGSVFRAGDGGAFTNLEASLTGVHAIGALELLAGRSFAATHGISDFGTIQLGGGTLTLPRLAAGAGGHVRGFGTIADTRYAISNGGTIEAVGGKLVVASAIDPASPGVFQLDASSILEIAADQGAADKMKFVGAGKLIIDAVQKFGLNAGSPAYTGPLVENFGTGDLIPLKNVASAGLTPVYDAASGILQLSNGSTNLASLAFDKTTLGTGSFHIGDDGHGHVLLTHS